LRVLYTLQHKCLIAGREYISSEDIIVIDFNDDSESDDSAANNIKQPLSNIIDKRSNKMEGDKDKRIFSMP